MLRDFQQHLQDQGFQAWTEGAINVMFNSPTGSGKTVIMADTIIKKDCPTVAIAHRQELVGQLCLALNREKVPHGIIAPKEKINQIIALEVDTHGYSRYNARANTRAASVDTLIRRDAGDRWFKQVGLVAVDEGHHVLKANKWGQAVGMFSDACGAFFTAHALRADGAGLGRPSDGLVDRLVVGPCGRDLIDRGFLADYRLVCPPVHKYADVPVSASGDFNPKLLAAAVHQDGTIVGDVVRHYLQFTPGALGITFAVDISSAQDIAKAYRAAGVPAEIITGDTPPAIRAGLMKKFRARQILMMVSVDVLGEGVDVPAVEVIIWARPTASFQFYAQGCGRGGRLALTDFQAANWHLYTDEQRLEQIAASAKPNFTIIDPVGNWSRFYDEHGMVCSKQDYVLTRREKKTKEKKGDTIQQRACLFCFLTYESFLPKCPHCKMEHVPQGRTHPAQVDGDLMLLDPQTLATLRGEARKVDEAPAIPRNAGPMVTNSILKNHREKQAGQATLRDAMAIWGGWQEQLKGLDTRTSQRKFFHTFGMDVMSAQGLGTKDAWTLEQKIRSQLHQHNIVSTT
jgi:DNA repair protein RadD